MLFSALDRGLQAHLLRTAPERRFADGQIIQQRGEAADGFWLIEEGSVMVGQFLPEGEFGAVALLGPGDSYGELAVFSGKPRIVDAVSRGASRLRLIAARPFLDALGNYPASTRALLGALAAQLQDTLAQLAGLRHGTNPRRLAALLVTLAGEGPGESQGEGPGEGPRAGADPGRLSVAVTQQDLADLLGVTRATANAALRELQDRRLVERGYGRVIVPDRDRLAGFALR